MTTITLSNDDGATTRSLSYFNLMMQGGFAKPMTPPMTPRTVPVVNRAGPVYFGTQMSERPFDLPLAFNKSVPRKEMELSAREFIKFIIDGTGQPRALRLRFDYDNDKYYTAYYAGTMPLEQVIRYGKFTLPLIAFDPIAYLTQNVGDLAVESDLIVDCDLSPDDEFSFAGINTETTVQINNFGGLNVRPVIEITGNFSTLTIEIGDGTLTYGEAISSQTLTLDLKKRTAKVGSTNKNSKVSGDWPELALGYNDVTIGGTDLDCSVEFIFKTQYL
jgi:phage-related protein